MCGEFGNSEIEFIYELFHVEGISDASKFDYSYLNNTEQFINRVYPYFKRKYADDTDIPETQIKECLGNFYLTVLNMDESNINKEFLRNLHLTVFPPEMGEFFGIAKVEALRGLAVVIVVATLLQRHGFFQGNIIPNSSSNLDSNPPAEHIYDPDSIDAGFTSWLAEYDPDHIIDDNLEEYGRLARFYHVCTIIYNKYNTGERLKGMYIFVGACLEGIPDEVVRVYSLGSERSELTRRRENIFTQITGVEQRKRTTKPKNSNSGRNPTREKELEVPHPMISKTEKLPPKLNTSLLRMKRKTTMMMMTHTKQRSLNLRVHRSMDKQFIQTGKERRQPMNRLLNRNLL